MESRSSSSPHRVEQPRPAEQRRRQCRRGASEPAYTLLRGSGCDRPLDELTLHLERVLPAPRPLVFRAHAEPDLLAKWWGPTGFSAPSIEFDLRVGGRYRIAMQPPDGVLFYLSGEFLEINPPTRLAYTFRWEDPDPDDRETIVTFSLGDLDESTELSVDQGVFATEGRRALHKQGWTESLDRLQELMSSSTSG
jgi:uncharacterized protein YndB with AHSA1/START domain